MKKVLKVLLDCGHGGSQPGAVYGGVEEKDITLDVCKSIEELLKDKVLVFLTRDNDSLLTLTRRLEIIKELEPDCFISVHCNAAENPTAEGIETFYSDDNDFDLAASIHKNLVAETSLKDRKVKEDVKARGFKFKVLGNFETPSCLVEIGFLSNESDRKYILGHKLVIAQAISRGILEFIGL